MDWRCRARVTPARSPWRANATWFYACGSASPLSTRCCHRSQHQVVSSSLSSVRVCFFHMLACVCMHARPGSGLACRSCVTATSSHCMPRPARARRSCRCVPRLRQRQSFVRTPARLSRSQQPKPRSFMLDATRRTRTVLALC